MFDPENFHNIAVITDWAHKRLSVKAIGAFATMSKNFFTVCAAGITSGLPFKQWECDSKIEALIVKFEASAEVFSDLWDAEIVESDQPL